MTAHSSSLKGVLVFHSETGTEGGYWAFQDSSWISYDPCLYGAWPESEVWDQNHPQRRGIVQDAVLLRGKEELPLPDPISTDGDYLTSSLFRGEAKGNRDADARLEQRYGFHIIYSEEAWNRKWGRGKWTWEDDSHTTALSPEGQRYSSMGTPATEPRRPYGVSRNDVTRNTVAWEDGQTEVRSSATLLQKRHDYSGLHILATGDYLKIFDNQEKMLWEGTIVLQPYPLFTESIGGMWIHADQLGVDREEWAHWFFQELPARLQLKSS